MDQDCGNEPCSSRHQHRQKLLINKGPFQSLATAKDLLSSPEASKSDRNLKKWGKWVEERKKQSKNLTETIKRPPVDLIMNAGEKVREVKERKMVLEHSQVKEKPGLRGGLWEQPNRLSQTCPCKPVYEIQRTRVEKGNVPAMEYVAVPEYIKQEELGLVGKAKRRPCKETAFETSKYKADREKELSQEIQRIEPYRPSLGKLMVKGNRPKSPLKKPILLPIISITEDLTSCNKEMYAVYALRINNTVFIKEEPNQCLDHLRSMQKEDWHQNTTLWTYYFNVPITKLSRNKLALKNLGTVTLRYCWHSVKPMCPSLPDSLNEPVFFFNKNEDVIYPGQKKEIYFTFISKMPGIFEEAWHLHICNVEFLDSIVKNLSITLNGDAVEPDLDYKENEIQRLNNYIDDEANKFAIHLTLNETLSKAVDVPPEPYPYKKMFIEENIFIMKNPFLYYHQTEVEKLKEMYKGIVGFEAEWDLSIRSLREVIMTQPFDERMQYYAMLRNSHDTLLKPWEEGDTLSKQKLRAMRQLLCQFLDKFDEEKLRLKRAYRNNVQQGSRERVAVKTKDKEVCKELFYVTIKEHFAETVEIGAAVLSSLDLYRWIEFDW